MILILLTGCTNTHTHLHKHAHGELHVNMDHYAAAQVNRFFHAGVLHKLRRADLRTAVIGGSPTSA